MGGQVMKGKAQGKKKGQKVQGPHPEGDSAK